MTDTASYHHRGDQDTYACSCGRDHEKRAEDLFSMGSDYSVGFVDGSGSALVINNDDAAIDNTSTSNSMDVGDVFTGNLNYVGDTDWIAIELTAGTTVRISLDGVTLSDPLLRLFNANGQQVAINDDANGALDSEIEFTVFESGTYYIVADSYQSSGTGTYQVSVTEFTPPPTPPFDPLDTIDWGTAVSGSVINVYMAPNGYSADGVTSEGWTAYEIGQVRLAFDLIEEVVDLEFNIVSNPSQADFIMIADTNELNALGYFNPPGTFNAGVGVFGVGNWDRFPGGDLEQGGFGFVTITHEILHGLGLAHPHDPGGLSSVMPQVNGAFGDPGAYLLNQGVFTTMSYNTGFIAGPNGTPGDTNGNYGFEAGPMALDIAVLQDRYGANTSTRTGNSTYDLPDANVGGTEWRAIWDAGGTDRIRYSGSRDTIIDLRPATLEDEFGGGGFISNATGIAGGFTIANGVVIENAEGGSGDDTINGNSADNRLEGGRGNDEITGDSGDDTLLGEAGNDTLIADRGDDLLQTGGGRDVGRGGSGDDTLLGGGGNDTLQGGNNADMIRGGNGADVISGQRHGDTISGGNGGDRLIGGGGNDEIRGDGGRDFINGGSRNDYINGGVGDDTLLGGSGRDSLYGGDNDDILTGGTGNDLLRGGVGSDVFVFEEGHDSDRIIGFDVNEDRLELDLALTNGITNTDAIVAEFAEETSNGVLFDFGGGDTILLRGVSSVNGLADAIDLLV